MKPFILLFIGLVLEFGIGVVSIEGQQQVNIPFSASIPAPVTSSNATPIGTKGLSTYYYWVIANYPIGGVAPTIPANITNSPYPLTSSNYVRITWTLVNNAINYDILRTITPQFPGSCSSCLVTSGNTSGNFNDQGGSLTSYSFTPVSPANAVLFIDNQNNSIPMPRVILNNTLIPWSIQTGVVNPSTPCLQGQIFYNSTTPGWVGCSNNSWVAIGGGGSTTACTTTITTNCFVHSDNIGNITINNSAAANTSNIGDGAVANAVGATAIGYQATASDLHSVAIGYQASSPFSRSVAIGDNASNNALQSVAIGFDAESADYGTAIGNDAITQSDHSVAIGFDTRANQFGVAIGATAIAGNSNSIAIGTSTGASNSNSIAIGNNASATNINGMAIGNGANSAFNNSTAIGNGATTTSDNQMMFGNSSVLNNIFNGNVTVGTLLPITLDSSAIGSYIKAGQTFAPNDWKDPNGQPQIYGGLIIGDNYSSDPSSIFTVAESVEDNTNQYDAPAFIGMRSTATGTSYTVLQIKGEMYPPSDIIGANGEVVSFGFTFGSAVNYTGNSGWRANTTSSNMASGAVVDYLFDYNSSGLGELPPYSDPGTITAEYGAFHCEGFGQQILIGSAYTACFDGTTVDYVPGVNSYFIHQSDSSKNLLGGEIINPIIAPGSGHAFVCVGTDGVFFSSVTSCLP